MGERGRAPQRRRRRVQEDGGGGNQFVGFLVLIAVLGVVNGLSYALDWGFWLY